MLYEWFSRARHFLSGKRLVEVDEELQFHLDREIEANLAVGMSPTEAARKAAIAFGGRERIREMCREQLPSWSMELLLRDLRFAVRGLLRNPGFTIVAVLTLALAIGANTTISSLLSQALMRALPVADPERLVVISFAGGHPGHTQSDGGNTPDHAHEFSYLMYRDLRDKNSAFSGLVAAAPVTIGVTWNNRAEAVPAEMVSGNYFQALGVRPAIGRLFVATDETAAGSNPVAVLSFDFWKTHLSEAPVVGKTLVINGTPFSITGVASPGFHSIVWGRVPAVYVPITMQRIVQPEWSYLEDRSAYWLNIVGRLRPDITTAEASASINPLFLSLRRAEFAQLRDQSQKAREGFITRSHINIEAGAKGFSPLRDDMRTPLTIIMGMVLLIIGMAVVNVASLLLVRAANRVREFSVRYALGATSGQILRQLLAEGMLLGFVGAAIGFLLAPQALHLLIVWMSGNSPAEPMFTATLDWRVFIITIAVTLLGSFLFSLAPVLQFWNPRLASALKQQAGTGLSGSLKFRRTCVALQIGFSLLLIVAAGMFVRTIQNLRSVNPGFETDHLLTFALAPGLAGYPASGVVKAEQRALETIANLPGVRAVGATNDADLAGDDRLGDVKVNGYVPRPDEEFDVELPWVSDGYLQALGVPLVVGRYFNASDTAASQKVAIVNESFTRHFFANPLAALGRHVSRPNRPATDAVIVGVVRDVKHTSVRDPARPTAYIPFLQAEKPVGLTFYVRTWQAPQTASNNIRAAVVSIDPRFILNNLSTMSDQIDANIVAERTIALLAATFGVLAALLAGIGLYGILAYTTAQRSREIGIRMALGAQRGTVIALIVRETLILAGCAIAATIPVAVLATRAVRSQLFGVSIVDPGVYAAAIVAISLVAVLAGFVPARRAASVDPARALRTD